MALRDDLTGREFGRLTVIKFLESRPRKRGGTDIYWLCKCNCEKGRERIVTGHNLRRGFVRSCGCLKGHSKFGPGGVLVKFRSEYKTWAAMIQRCANPNCSIYEYYGGRGVNICERWRHSFGNFLADMGPKPTPDHSLDRINVDGNYEPGNVRWADILTQTNNQRSNRRLTFNGKNQTIAEWSRELNISQSVIHNRLRRKWPIKDVLSTAVLKHGSHYVPSI